MFTVHNDLTIEVSRFLLAALAVAEFAEPSLQIEPKDVKPLLFVSCNTIIYIISVSVVEREREREIEIEIK